MKKQFLLLLWMTLLPLAGWAQSINLADGWKITLDPELATYTGGNVKPTVKLSKTGESDMTDGFTVEWSENEIINVNAVDGYTVTVTADGTKTYGKLAENTAVFYVLKATPATTAPTPAAATAFTGEPITLITAAGITDFGTMQYIVSDGTPAADAAGWSTEFPKETNAGTYEVWYKVDGTSNWNAVAPTYSGTVKITGIDATISNPTAKTLTYNGKEQVLIEAAKLTAGTGTLYYKLSTDSEWSTELPKAKNGGAYTVNWKFEGTNGYNSQSSADVAVTIGKANPDISAATGATGLTYNGGEQKLLTKEATEALDATVIYDVTYQAPGAGSYTSFLTGATFDKVVAQNAGDYKIKAKVAEDDNFNAGEAAELEVAIAQKEAKAPVAIKNLRYNGEAQSLIEAGEEGVIVYVFGGSELNSIETIKGTNAETYEVKYKVTDSNYKQVSETAIEDVEIKGALLTIKVPLQKMTSLLSLQ